MSHPHISTATTSEFPNVVLEQSRSGPVLVDFWAEWCGPCKSLAPTLEALADKLDGALKIVKVDTDAEPEIATQYAIRSLPTLMLFKDATNVAQVVGAQPLSELEKFVAAWLPRPADKFIDAAESARDQGDSATAIEAFERAIGLDPLDFNVHPILGGLYIDAGRIDDARALLRALPANMAVDKRFDNLKSRLNMADAAANTDEPTDDVGHAFAAAVASANSGDYDAGVSALIGLLPAQRDWQDDAIRKALVDIFNVLDGDPRVRIWRTQMARALN